MLQHSFLALFRKISCEVVVDGKLDLFSKKTEQYCAYK